MSWWPWSKKTEKELTARELNDQARKLESTAHQLRMTADARARREARGRTKLVEVVCIECKGAGDYPQDPCETCDSRGWLEMVKWQGSPNHDHYQYDDDHVPDYYSQLRFDERNGVGAGLPKEEEEAS